MSWFSQFFVDCNDLSGKDTTVSARISFVKMNRLREERKDNSVDTDHTVLEVPPRHLICGGKGFYV